jgi:hypothetical protein
MNILKTSVVLSLIVSIVPAFAQTRDVRPLFPNSQVRTLSDGSMIITPHSSIPQPGSGNAHTNYKVFQPATGLTVGNPPFAGSPSINTPGSLACIYREARHTSGCNPFKNFALPQGGSGTIAIVDAFDAPHAIADLVFFSNHFGLPQPNITVVYSDINGNQTPTPPAYNSGWEGEISLDVQMVHSMAPNAHIILVEAVNNSATALYNAELLAGRLVSNAGGGQISNSWGGGEYPGESGDDGVFVAPNVVFFASSGDSPGTEYPCVSPNIVCVGGTTVNRTSAGNYISQTAWSKGGGGSSAFEPRPAFQDKIANIVGNARGVPDVAAVADPATGVYVYISNQGGWFAFGGTSVASPVVAAQTNFEDRSLEPSSNAELNFIYAHKSHYTDVTAGDCGINVAKRGWDFCTGWGSPK